MDSALAPSGRCRSVRAMRPSLLMSRLERGEFGNVRFSDAVALLRSLGFDLVRVSGSHRIYAHPAIPELVNVQDVRGQAKPYQLRQVVALARRYALSVEEER